MKRVRTLLFVPTFNERENVEPLHQQIAALGLDLDMLFVDDGSPDGTGDVLEGIAAGDSRVRVIHRTGKLGIGHAHLCGIRYAYEHGYDRLVTMDCDFTHSPADIPALLAASERGDLAVGSRYLRPGSLPGWSPFRRFLTRLGHLLTKYLLGLSADASGAFRVYDLRAISPEVFDLVASHSYSFFFESLLILTANGCRVIECPIVLPARTYGHSKMNFREAWRSLHFLLGLWLENLIWPTRFRVGRLPDSINAELQAEEWDRYWGRMEDTSTLVYELVASAYRQIVIRRNLERVLRATFPAGAHILHAGCGSGQVDAHLHGEFRITAVDISAAAVKLYCRNNPDSHRVEQANILALPYPDQSFDGVYNLGVVEHFSRQNIVCMLSEFRRVLRPDGKIVVFWPHRHATSVLVLKAVHFFLRRVSKDGRQLHPLEVSLLVSREEARRIFSAAGFKLTGYTFGMRDGFVQAVVTGKKSESLGVPEADSLMRAG